MGFTQETEIVWVDPNILKEHPKNNNMHTPEQIEALAHSIRLNGETRAISVSLLTNYVVAGHCQLAASLYLGKMLVPVVYIKFMTEDEEYFYMTADNEVAKLAKRDDAALRREITLKGWSTPEFKRMGLTNFQTDEERSQERKEKHCPHCGGDL